MRGLPSTAWNSSQSSRGPCCPEPAALESALERAGGCAACRPEAGSWAALGTQLALALPAWRGAQQCRHKQLPGIDARARLPTRPGRWASTHLAALPTKGVHGADALTQLSVRGSTLLAPLTLHGSRREALWGGPLQRRSIGETPVPCDQRGGVQAQPAKQQCQQGKLRRKLATHLCSSCLGISEPVGCACLQRERRQRGGTRGSGHNVGGTALPCYRDQMHQLRCLPTGW